MGAMTDMLFVVGILLVAMIGIGVVLAMLYKRASKEVSFVRTGLGGQKVIMNGGAVVFPIFQELIEVNMNTLRLEVRRSEDQALITRDRMRVDVTAEFYVRVKPTVEAIADAAQTLGKKTLNPAELKALVEGKFVDALRSVAAEMSMEELHEKRVDFVQKVQRVVTEDLLKNGLELESVSLTGLDQTSREFFNPDNAFDAQGLTKLTETIEAKRKQRNDIEQDTHVAIQTKNLEAQRQKLSLTRDEEYAKLEQEREIAIRRAEQVAQIAQEAANKDREAKEAEIQARQHIDKTRIEAERAVEEANIEKQRLVRERDIQRQRAVEAAEVDKVKAIELAKQDQAIAIAEKSREQSLAQAEADQARAKAVKAEEEVITVQQTEIANRQKQIELVEAAKEAERSAIAVTVAAEAEKRAAEDRADAVKTIAAADAERVRITADGEASAKKLMAEAAKVTYAVDAEGKRAVHAAENVLSAEQIAMRIKLALVERLDSIIRESVKPIEKIDGIKIIQLQGLNGAIQGGANYTGAGDGPSTGAAGSGGGNLADHVVNSALRYRAQAPLLDSLMKEVGLSGGDINNMIAPVLTGAVSNGRNGGVTNTAEK
jgi:uncharacterized membrane protein YqiK